MIYTHHPSHRHYANLTLLNPAISPKQSAEDFITFVNASPSPFHAVAESKRRLEAAGFKPLSERDTFTIARNGKYYFTRNQSSIVAFAVGGAYQRGNGFCVVGAHTDSPCLKVKPKSKKEKVGYAKVGVECYGGGLWHTWFDRDLSIAGRVIVKAGDKLEHRLVRIDKPILRIPTLAIHLDRAVNSEGFKFNTETHLTPMLSSAAASLNEAGGISDKHEPLLLKKVSEQLKVQPNDISDFELCLFDTQPSTIGGGADEFIFSPRLDNLMSSYCAITAIINSVHTAGNLAADTNIRVVALFDNEEVGSQTAMGAGSNLMETTMKRLAEAELADGITKLSPTLSPTSSPSSSPSSWVIIDEFESLPPILSSTDLLSPSPNLATSYPPSPLKPYIRKSVYEQALSKSFLISADMAHAVHPNYAEKHEDDHRPMINKGIVIKQNANQRYATTAVTTALLREIAKKRDVPLQEFVVRNDSPCGSTIGPMLSAQLGVRTIDVGNPQLSMHSIRETCGTVDVKYAIDLFQSFFEDFAVVDAKLKVDEN
ncbi:hypothetical protein HDV05_005021 [Chytridiales sp. JEL 0842]|nr:hypothetical protein HDV05_005021 [Chytridiales sp. JEL 0842]